MFAGLGTPAILDNNEGLYAEIPREMLASGDWRMWVIPHLNGLPYMEKPPLLYWLTALSFALFGVSEWTARLVPAISSLSCVASLVWFGRVVGKPQVGRLGALMFVSGIGVMAMSRVLMFDMLLTALLTAALMHAYLYLTTERVAALRWSYAFLALALLAKGLVALILFGLVALSWIIFSQRSIAESWRACLKFLEPWALFLFFAIAAPWHVAASLTEPIFAWFYFVNEHVLRFLGKREPHDYYAGSWWYYLPRMVIYLFPWSLFLLVLLGKKHAFAGSASDVSLRRFLWLAWLMPLAFFSISSAKANYYLVAVMPFAAFHLALAFSDRNLLKPFARALPGKLIVTFAVLGLIVIWVTGKGVGELIVLGLTQKQFFIVVLWGLLAVSVISVLGVLRFGGKGVVAYISVSAWIGTALMTILLAMEPQVSTRPIARFLHAELPNHGVYLFRTFEEQSSLPFYLKHPVFVVDSRSNDLFWGNKLRRNDIVISADELSARAQGKKVVVVVLERHLKDFQSSSYFQYFKGKRQFGKNYVFYN